MNPYMTLIAGAAAAAIFVAGTLAPLPATRAQDGDGRPRAEDGVHGRFLERVAADLGIDVARLEQAIENARLQAIEEALERGAITEEQAARRSERVESGDRHGLRPLRGMLRNGPRKAMRDAAIERSAGAIGIGEDELRGRLNEGASIAGVAADHGVEVAAVKEAILDAARTRLDAAVTNGRIDRENADAILQRLDQRLDELLNRTRAPQPPLP
jgi:hypothetical protein